MTSILIRDREGNVTLRQRGKGHVVTEAGIGVMRPQTKKHQEPQKLEARKDSSIEPSKAVQLCQQLDVGLVASRTLREYISVVFLPPNL